MQFVLQQRITNRTIPFSLRIWDRPAGPAEFFRPKTRPPPAPSSSPANMAETELQLQGDNSEAAAKKLTSQFTRGT